MSWYKEIEFPIDTDIRRFENRLNLFRRRTLPMCIDLEEDKHLVVNNVQYLSNDSNQIRTHKINAAIATIYPELEKHSYMFPVIELELFESKEGRLNIKARVMHEKMQAYFVNLLEEIAKFWPESEDKITRFIEGMSDYTKFQLFLETSYHDFLDWFDDKYSYINLKDKLKNQFDLQFPNFTHTGQMTISLIDGGIKLTGWYSHYHSNEWLEIFTEKCINYFGELPEKRNGGRPVLHEDELIHRLSKAQEAEEIKITEIESSSPILKSNKSKRGQSKFTDQEKLDALLKWDAIAPGHKRLSVFLDEKFGNTAGILNVAVSTFHGWRSQLRNKGEYPPNNS